MYTRLALATGATVKAPRPLYRPTDRQAHRGPGPARARARAYTDLAYYGVWAPGSGDDIKRTTAGAPRTAKAKASAGTHARPPNIDLFEISKPRSLSRSRHRDDPIPMFRQFPSFPRHQKSRVSFFLGAASCWQRDTPIQLRLSRHFPAER